MKLLSGYFNRIDALTVTSLQFVFLAGVEYCCNYRQMKSTLLSVAYCVLGTNLAWKRLNGKSVGS